jgi:fumarylpyruvate hydrolase
MSTEPGYILAAEPRPTARVAGSELLWPIRRVLCVGRNYADHAREMGSDPDREPPFFFSKPGDAVVEAAGKVAYPPLTHDLHHEVELVVAIGRAASNASAEEAVAAIFGYAVGVDLTRRDLQNQAKDLRRPWDWAKGFDQSAPMSPVVPLARELSTGRIWLSVNGELRQDGDIADMIWAVPDIIASASKSIRLLPGDLIFTGTPGGVSALHPGDVVAGGVAEVAEFSFEISGAELSDQG